MIPTVKQIKELLIPRLLYYIDKKIAEGNSEITIAELLSILNRTYEPAEIEDDITDQDIQNILDEIYVPVDDEFTDSDFVF